MKLIKKITAIMFAFMMVVSMSCNVKADDTNTATTGEKATMKLNSFILIQKQEINGMLLLI